MVVCAIASKIVSMGLLKTQRNRNSQNVGVQKMSGATCKVFRAVVTENGSLG